MVSAGINMGIGSKQMDRDRLMGPRGLMEKQTDTQRHIGTGSRVGRDMSGHRQTDIQTKTDKDRQIQRARVRASC